MSGVVCDKILKAARRIIADSRTCVAVTLAQNGYPNARVLQTSAASDDWSIQFLTDARSRKAKELTLNPHLTLVYQVPASGEYAALSGPVELSADASVKAALWRPESLRWHPGGPADPNVLLARFRTERIEIWSSPEGLIPDPVKGLWAVSLTRDRGSWRVHTTMDERS